MGFMSTNKSGQNHFLCCKGCLEFNMYNLEALDMTAVLINTCS